MSLWGLSLWKCFIAQHPYRDLYTGSVLRSLNICLAVQHSCLNFNSLNFILELSERNDQMCSCTQICKLVVEEKVSGNELPLGK